MLYHPLIYRVVVNPQLEHHRSLLHPHIGWNVATHPLNAVQRNRVRSGSVERNIKFGEYATNPLCRSMMITFSSTIEPLVARWDTIYVERTDCCPLLVGDVLLAVHKHLNTPLTREEICTTAADEWDRVTRDFSRRVRGARRRGDTGTLVLSRLDFLKGQRKFDGLSYSGGDEFCLSLS